MTQGGAMLSLPNVLLIGATGRNVGKTEYAVRLVRRLTTMGSVAAAKITVIRDAVGSGNTACHRGHASCGVCGSLGERPYILDREESVCPVDGKDRGEKDTARLKRAGGNPVWWLRVKQAHLEVGLGALAQVLDPSVPTIVESNSARHGLKPSLFLMIRDGSGKIKASATAVMPYVDALVTRQGDAWDLGVERPTFSAGQWHLNENAGAILLAGGASRRMGQDKAFLDWQGQPLVAHIAGQLRRICADLIIGANDSAKFAFLAAPVIADRSLGQGPLMGLASCLAASRFDRNLVVACDMPRLNSVSARLLLSMADGFDAVVPRGADGRPEPLFAVYRKSCLPALEKVLAHGGRRFTDLLEQVQVRWVESSELFGLELHNLNTPEEYSAAKELEC